MTLAILLGTRPEVVKLAPLIWELEKRKEKFLLIHSGQHYDFNMSQVFFDELGIRKPDSFLEVGSSSHAIQTARIMVGVEEAIKKNNITTLVVLGDTNTVLAGAIAAKKLGIRVAHVESGCRSFDKTMPEEINRILTDQISDYRFTPSEFCRKNLVAEGMSDNITITGCTEFETLEFALKKKKKPFETPKDFALVTIHRQENTTPEKLKVLMALLEKTPLEKSFLIHPRTKKIMDENKIKPPANTTLKEPVGYFELAWLLKECNYVITDSGGLQKEAAFLGKKVIIARENSEWLDVLESGFGTLVGLDEKSAEKAKAFLNAKAPVKPLQEHNRASKIIANVLSSKA